MSVEDFDMEEQLRVLAERVQQLQADNERLRSNGGAGTSASGNATEGSVNLSETRGVTERYVYMPRERKCPRFSGKPTDVLTVEDWVEEVHRSLESRHMSQIEQALFIYDQLDGEAKNEIKFRPLSERNDPKKILDILKEIYGCSQSYIGLQKQFFQRRQLDGESLREYSHALLSLMEAVKRRSPRLIPNADHLVRDQFIEHVRDGMLRRELKRLVRLDSNVSFLTIRSEAIQWVEEGEHVGNPRARAYSCDTQVEVMGECNMESQTVTLKATTELSELKECLRKQQAQLDMLMNHLSLTNTHPPPHREPMANAPGPFRYDPTGKPICLRCNQVGHIARFCRAGRGPSMVPRGGNSRSSPRTGVVASISEPQGN